MRTCQTLLDTASPEPFDFRPGNKLRGEGFSSAIFCKPKVDTRTASSTIESRNGTAFHGVVAFDSLDDVPVTENALIAVDEAQFFDSSLLRLHTRVQNTIGSTLVVAGLDRDFQREPFGHVLELAEMIVSTSGGQVHMLRAPCHVEGCEAPAPYTKRIAQADSQILIGGSESYVPACLHHHR
jgi:thymidine kinase